MRKVFGSDDTLLAGHILSLLEAHGIACHARNMSLSGGLGELPVNECWPEIWVNDDADSQRARSLIAACQTPAGGGEWECPCRERMETQFEFCWSCGAERAD